MNRIVKEASTYDLADRVIGLAIRIPQPGLLQNMNRANKSGDPRKRLRQPSTGGLCLSEPGVEMITTFYCRADIHSDALALEHAGIPVARESRWTVLNREHVVSQLFSDFLIEAKNEKLIHPVKPPAFTLLELLVALAVLSILVVMMMGLVTSATALWRSNENRADAYREARAAFSIMSRDLAGTMATQTNHFLPNSAARPSLAGDTIVFDPARQGALLFLTALPANAQQSGINRSDVCQAGYFLAFDRTSMSKSADLPGGQESLNLYRYFLSSDPTFALLTNSPVFPSTINPISDSVDLLAKNVREFRITPLVLTNGTYSTNFTPTTNAPLPDLLEISLTAVNREAARQLPDRTSWTNAVPPEPISRSQQTFTIRIPIKR